MQMFVEHEVLTNMWWWEIAQQRWIWAADQGDFSAYWAPLFCHHAVFAKRARDFCLKFSVSAKRNQCGQSVCQCLSVSAEIAPCFG